MIMAGICLYLAWTVKVVKKTYRGTNRKFQYEFSGL